jgi:hypothetical protein
MNKPSIAVKHYQMEVIVLWQEEIIIPRMKDPPAILHDWINLEKKHRLKKKRQAKRNNQRTVK